MCGHFGMAGRGISQKDQNAFIQLGIVTQLRGLDGAGVYIDRVSAGHKPPILPLEFKSEHDFSHLATTKGSWMKSWSADVFLGHCRAATIGAVNIDNVHPFSKGDWVIAHNGTVYADEYNEDLLKTDSEQIAEAIADDKIGPTNALNVLSDWDAFAIVAVDKKEGSILFTRNWQRTLHYAISNERDVLYWASEKPFLEMVLDRAGVGSYTIYTFPEDHTYTVMVDDIKAGETKLFYVDSLDYKKPKPWSKSDTTPDKDVPSFCPMCKEELTSSDYTWGMYSEYRGGVVCEECVYGADKYA